MIKQSLQNRLNVKYVKAGIGDEVELYDHMKDDAAKPGLSAEEQIFDNLNKLFVSYLNNNAPGMKYGALRVLAKPPFSWMPMIALMDTKEQAQSEFMSGNTDMAPYFLEIQRIFEEDMQIKTTAGRDNFIQFVIETAKENNAFDFAHKSSAQVLWNKLLSLYTGFNRTVLQKLGIDTDVPVRPEDVASYSAGTQSPEVGELFKDLATVDPVFNEYRGAFGINYALGLFDDAGMTGIVPQLARKYSRVARYSRDTTHVAEFRDAKDAALNEIVKHQMFPKMVEILTDSLTAYKTEVINKKLDTAEKRDEQVKRRKEEEKLSGPKGLDTEGRSKEIHIFRKLDDDFNNEFVDNINIQGSMVSFLRTLKNSDPALFIDFSSGVRSSIMPDKLTAPDGSPATDQQKLENVKKKVAEFKQSDTYKKSLATVRGVRSGSTNRTPTITEKTPLATKDSEIADLKAKLEEMRAKRAKYMRIKTKAKQEGDKEKEDKVRAASQKLESNINLLLEQGKKLGVTL